MYVGSMVMSPSIVLQYSTVQYTSSNRESRIPNSPSRLPWHIHNLDVRCVLDSSPYIYKKKNDYFPFGKRQKSPNILNVRLEMSGSKGPELERSGVDRHIGGHKH